MKLEDLLKAFGDAGLGDDEIKQALCELKGEIDKYLGGGCQDGDDAPIEDEDAKQKELFGI